MARDDPLAYDEKNPQEAKAREEIRKLAEREAKGKNAYETVFALFEQVRAGGKLGLSYFEKGVISGAASAREQDFAVLRGIELYRNPKKRGDCNELSYLLIMMLRDANPAGFVGAYACEAVGGVKIPQHASQPPYQERHNAVAVVMRGKVPEEFKRYLYVKFEKTNPAGKTNEHFDKEFRAQTLRKLGVKDNEDTHMLLIDPSMTMRGNNFGAQYDRITVWSDNETRANFAVEKASYALAKGEKEKARTLLQESIRIKDTAEAHGELAAIFLSEKKEDAAATEYEKALKINPQNFQAASNLSTIREKQGKRQEAIKLREQIVRYSDNPLTRLDLAEAYTREGRLEDAEQSAAIAITGFERARKTQWEGIARAALGDVHAIRGNLDAAITEYEKAVKLYPLPGYSATLGLMMIARGKRTDAKQAAELLKQAIAQEKQLGTQITQRLQQINTPLAREALQQIQGKEEKRTPIAH